MRPKIRINRSINFFLETQAKLNPPLKLCAKTRFKCCCGCSTRARISLLCKTSLIWRKNSKADYMRLARCGRSLSGWNLELMGDLSNLGLSQVIIEKFLVGNSLNRKRKAFALDVSTHNNPQYVYLTLADIYLNALSMHFCFTLNSVRQWNAVHIIFSDFIHFLFLALERMGNFRL